MSIHGFALPAICTLALTLISCGGSTNGVGTPQEPDFAISVDTSSITQQAGGAALPFTIGIAAQWILRLRQHCGHGTSQWRNFFPGWSFHYRRRIIAIHEPADPANRGRREFQRDA